MPLNEESFENAFIVKELMLWKPSIDLLSQMEQYLLHAVVYG
jgi:hypothetical protein